MKSEEQINDILRFLYGDDAASVWKQLKAKIEEYQSKFTDRKDNQNHPKQIDETDIVLITYGDQITESNQLPLKSLGKFLQSNLLDLISTIHILPFYPYSSDDGFSVIDYRQVDPKLGDWQDIANIGSNFHLMFDAVINHISRESFWFQSFVEGDEYFRNFFICADPTIDLSKVVRPRALPLLTQVDTADGQKHVWSTFSDDQIDLNYANPDVLLQIIDLVLYYAMQGANVIRLDAIAYLWKEIGTTCIHLPQTHAVVKLFRAVLNFTAPDVILITETNVPHEDNISYFGEVDINTGNTDEAQMVYQFPLAPLVLNAFQTGNAERLLSWVDNLEAPAPFFNFLASHDGIGVMPARGLLSDADIQALVDQTLSHGGQVSYKSNPDGSQSVYELNITLYDILNDPAKPFSHIDLARFLASQAIMLSLKGVPGIYFHSLFGSRNCQTCLDTTSRARSINREKFELSTLSAKLEDKQSQPGRVFSGYRKMLLARRQESAFHPFGHQEVLFIDPAVFALLRVSPDNSRSVICLINVSASERFCRLDLNTHHLPNACDWHDLIANDIYQPVDQFLEVRLAPYQSCWLAPLHIN